MVIVKVVIQMKKLIKAFALTIMACFMVLLVLGFIEYRSVIREMPIQDKVASIMQKDDYVPIDEISDYLKVATISTEDKRFYKHQGVDLIAYGRILYVFITSGQISGGGSTITQQLAKNMYFSFQPSIIRKVAEFFVTKDLERLYDKDTLLELYLNIINYGDNNIGIASASMNYFHVEPADLSFDQATLLAGIPQSPANYQLSNHEDQARLRQQAVLATIEDNGYYDDDELARLLLGVNP